MTGNGNSSPSNQGSPSPFLKPATERAPIAVACGPQLMGKSAPFPVSFPFLRPSRSYPVLEISTGATNQNQGQYASPCPGGLGSRLYDRGRRLLAEARSSRAS